MAKIKFIAPATYPNMNRLPLFPITTKIENDCLTIDGQALAQLAEQYGTPLYLYDGATLNAAVDAYHHALATHYPGPASVTYAGKAYLSMAIVRWAVARNLLVDCTGAGEIAIARAGGAPPAQILVHGVNKSLADLRSAFEHAGTIVVDNLDELKKIKALAADSHNSIPQLWLRLLPGVAVSTHHAHTQTGQHDSKFGMTYEEALTAAEFCKEHHLPLNGIHFHQGSNFRDPEPLLPAIELGLDLAQRLGLGDEWHFCPGGGWGAAYHEDELPHPSIEVYVRGVAEAVKEGCASRKLRHPMLHLEPGRSLAARAGVALYRVGAIKKRGAKTWALIDGGMTDNPRFALYGARYSCLPVSGPGGERSELVSIAGPYCESGDVLIEDLPMPKLKAGELIAIPVAGAYHLSMSSNYNGARRPAVVWLEHGSAKLIQRAETFEDLLKRDV
ncbi:MAG: diaminopimelate decarboxylase [Anaerolineales bacterium]|nr:diaminopimelate decarboxylase [Anaerolineales bacterium]